ncbi:MAG: sugar kinase [Streptosporangiaceae bacterium]
MTGPATGPLDVVTFGEAMVLLLAEPGVPLRAAATYRRSVAGAESNVACGLARLGHRVGWFGRVGADPFGDIVLATLRADGVDVSRVRVDGGSPTGLLVRDCHGERAIDVLYYRSGSAGGRLSPGDLDSSYIAAGRVLHLSGITALLGADARATSRAAVETARAAGVPVSFDPNVRRKLAPPAHAAELLRPLAAGADVVFATADEVALLAGEDGPGWFLDRGAGLVVVKEGVRGAYATDGARTWRRPATAVAPADPVGAGDGFAAGFLSAWLRGHRVDRCLIEAGLVAAMVVQVATDLDGLPTAAQRDAALAREDPEVGGDGDDTVRR